MIFAHSDVIFIFHSPFKPKVADAKNDPDVRRKKIEALRVSKN